MPGLTNCRPHPTSLPYGWLGALALMVAAMMIAAPAAAAQVPQARWLMDDALEEALARPVSLTWQGEALREGLRQFSVQQRVAIVIDRRLDPSQPLRLNIAEQPLEEVFAEIGRQQGFGVCRVENVIYFGPEEVARDLATVAALANEQADSLPAAARTRWRVLQTLTWDDLASPQSILQQIAEGNGLRLPDLDGVPHDLWAGADLPLLSLAGRLSLVLAQFDLALTIGPDGQTVRFVPLPEKPVLVKTYPAGRQLSQRLTSWALLVPEAKVAPKGRVIEVAGRMEDHRKVEADLRPTRSAVRRTQTEKRYSLTVENKPLGPVLAAIAQQAGYELELDRQAVAAAGISLDQLVSLKTDQATLPEMLGQLLKPTGLEFRVVGERITVEVP